MSNHGSAVGEAKMGVGIANVQEQDHSLLRVFQGELFVYGHVAADHALQTTVLGTH